MFEESEFWDILLCSYTRLTLYFSLHLGSEFYYTIFCLQYGATPVAIVLNPINSPQQAILT